MNAHSAVMLMWIVAVPAASFSQGGGGSWSLQPRLALGKLLPGAPLEHPEYVIPT